MWKSFEKIAPFWSKLIKAGKVLPRRDNPTKQKPSISDYKFCVVGEAHGLEGGYAGSHSMRSSIAKSCNKCYQFSQDFYTHTKNKKDKYITPNEYRAHMDETVIKFTLHFNDKHNKPSEPLSIGDIE